MRGGLKLIDFGLAHSLQDNQNTLTFPNSVPGSFHYTAPENFRYFYKDGRKVPDFDEDDDDEGAETHIELTQKADIWAAGIILYGMVYEGMHPYGTVGGGRMSKMNALKADNEVKLPEMRFNNLDATGLVETMKACLRKDPTERATAQELLKMHFLSSPSLMKM